MYVCVCGYNMKINYFNRVDSIEGLHMKEQELRDCLKNLGMLKVRHIALKNYSKYVATFGYSIEYMIDFC